MSVLGPFRYGNKRQASDPRALLRLAASSAAELVASCGGGCGVRPDVLRCAAEMTSQAPPDDKKRLLNRLRRLEGQVRGLQRMVEEDRPCLEVLTLLAGVRSALNATGDLVLERYLTDCLTAPPGSAQARAIIEAMRLAKRST